jgi:hypothetical protein
VAVSRDDLARRFASASVFGRREVLELFTRGAARCLCDNALAGSLAAAGRTHGASSVMTGSGVRPFFYSPAHALLLATPSPLPEPIGTPMNSVSGDDSSASLSA